MCSSKAKLTLPFSFDRPFTAYLHSAYICGILNRDGLINKQLFDINILLRFPVSKIEAVSSGKDVRHLVDYSPHFDLELASVLEMIEFRRLASEKIISLRSPDYVSLIQATIASGAFVKVYADEYFVKGTAAYKRVHHRHQHLLIGFDCETSVFIGACYLESGRFGAGTVAFEEVASAYCIEPLSGSGPMHVEVRAGSKPHHRTNWKAIRMQMRDVVQSANTLSEYHAVICQDRSILLREGAGRSEYRYGLSVYPLLSSYITKCITDNKSIDLRMTRLLWEHACLIKLRAGVMCGELQIRLAVNVEMSIKCLVSSLHALHIMACESHIMDYGDSELSYMLGLVDASHRSELCIASWMVEELHEY